MKIKTICVLLLTSLFIIISCSTNNKLIKLHQNEIIRLAKVDSLNNRISKILDPQGKEISREEISQYPPSLFYNDKYKDPDTDSIILKIRKIKKTDFVVKQKIGFYTYYGKYADTITSPITINCTKVDSLLTLIYNRDQRNRSNEIEMSILTDAQNQKILFNIINQCGFPNSKKNKKESIFYAFIILLHSDNIFKEKYFNNIQSAVKQGDLNRKHLAFFEDKMNISAGKTQKYGTQMLIDNNGNEILAPIDNLKKVNQRRKKIGLEPLNL